MSTNIIHITFVIVIRLIKLDFRILINLLSFKNSIHINNCKFKKFSAHEIMFLNLFKSFFVLLVFLYF